MTCAICYENDNTTKLRCSKCTCEVCDPCWNTFSETESEIIVNYSIRTYHINLTRIEKMTAPCPQCRRPSFLKCRPTTRSDTAGIRDSEFSIITREFLSSFHDISNVEEKKDFLHTYFSFISLNFRKVPEVYKPHIEDLLKNLYEEAEYKEASSMYYSLFKKQI